MKKTISLMIMLLCFIQVFSQTKIELVFVEGFSQQEQQRVETNIGKLQDVINSDFFGKQVLEGRFLRKRIRAYQKRFDNQEILELIRGGRELNSEYDSVITLKLKLYDSEKNEIGHTDSEMVINTFRGYMNDNPVENYLSHLLHEYCHVIGFRHAFLKLPFRSKTVPYSIGKITLNTLKQGAQQYQ